MKSWIVFVLLAATTAAQAHDEKEIAEDIERHRAMAAAHEAVVKCLEEDKKDHDTCYKELQENSTCKTLAIGKHCGLRSHSH